MPSFRERLGWNVERTWAVAPHHVHKLPAVALQETYKNTRDKSARTFNRNTAGSCLAGCLAPPAVPVLIPVVNLAAFMSLYLRRRIFNWGDARQWRWRLWFWAVCGWLLRGLRRHGGSVH